MADSKPINKTQSDGDQPKCTKPNWITTAWDRISARLFPQRTLGQLGETAAERYLRRQGLKIIGRGERDQLGELDLVAADGRVIVFVEVKTRATTVGGEPHDAVDEEKQRRLTRAALGFLKRHGLTGSAARFDVVSIIWNAGEKRPRIEHIVNAFEAVGSGQMFN